jgi:hypothetical protein
MTWSDEIEYSIYLIVSTSLRLRTSSLSFIGLFVNNRCYSTDFIVIALGLVQEELRHV